METWRYAPKHVKKSRKCRRNQTNHGYQPMDYKMSSNIETEKRGDAQHLTVALGQQKPQFKDNFLLLLAAPTWLWGRCGRHNSPQASSAMDFIFRRSDGSHVSVDTVHPSLLRYSSFSSPRCYHLQSLFSDVV